jgi:copper transport protein
VLVALLANTATPTRWHTALAALLGAGILLSFSAAGHAAAQPAPLLPVLADWLHLAASSVWVGGLVVLAASLPATLGVLQTTERARALAALIVRFSTLALGSVVALTVSGVYAAWLHIAALSDLWGSDYGRALLVKLVLFGLMIALGAYNTWVVRPRFVAWAERAAASALMRSWQQLFVWAVRGEVLAAALLIGAVGYLTNSAPPGSQADTQTPVAALPATPPPATALPQPTRTPVPSRPFAETRQIDDVQLSLEIAPASIGKNTFRVAIRDAQGQPVAVQKVELALAMAEMEMGEIKLEVTPEGQGTFVVSDGWLSMVGEWNVHITVRRADADDITAEFVVPVGG